MPTLLKIEASALPRTLTLDPPISDEEFAELCRENRDLRLERTRHGAIQMHAPTGGWTGSGNQEINRQLGNWWSMHERGRVFDSSTGFRLPDGSTLSPDASYVSEERLGALPPGSLRGFPPVCPDFVVELRSESDSLGSLEEKMVGWIANGAALGWLIDPAARQVRVYRPGQEVEVVTARSIAGCGPVKGFVLDLGRVWKCFQD